MPDVPTVKLTSSEKRLLAKIDFALSGENVGSSLTAAGELTRSLLNRNAILEIRLRYFTDPDLNLGRSCSRKETFERNGTANNAIFGHPHFLPYLRYFLFGPQLPEETITAFAKGIDASGGFISGSDLPDLNQLITQSIRTHGLNPSAAAEEFYKLGLECGLARSSQIGRLLTRKSCDFS